MREAVNYVHYHRIIDVAKADASFKAGLEVMRNNMEKQEHQVDFDGAVRKREGEEGPQSVTKSVTGKLA